MLGSEELRVSRIHGGSGVFRRSGSTILGGLGKIRDAAVVKVNKERIQSQSGGENYWCGSITTAISIKEGRRKAMGGEDLAKK